MRLLDLWNCCSLHIMLSDVFGAELCYAALVHMVGADLILVFLNLILCAVKCTLFCILCLHFIVNSLLFSAFVENVFKVWTKLGFHSCACFWNIRRMLMTWKTSCISFNSIFGIFFQLSEFYNKDPFVIPLSVPWLQPRSAEKKGR